MNGITRVALLLRKDLWLHFWAIVILRALEMGSFLTFAAQFPPAMRSLSGGFLQGITAIGTFMIGYRLLASEDSVGSLTFLKSLPLSTTEIFGSKILFMWGYVLLNSLTLNGGYLATRLLVPSWELGLISWGGNWGGNSDPVGIRHDSGLGRDLGWFAESDLDPVPPADPAAQCLRLCAEPQRP